MKKSVAASFMVLIATSLSLTSYASNPMKQNSPQQKVTKQDATIPSKQKKSQSTQTYLIKGEATMPENTYNYEVKVGTKTIKRGWGKTKPRDSSGLGWGPFEQSISIPPEHLSSNSPITVEFRDTMSEKQIPTIIPLNSSAMKKTFTNSSFRNVKISKISTSNKKVSTSNKKVSTSNKK